MSERVGNDGVFVHPGKRTGGRDQLAARNGPGWFETHQRILAEVETGAAGMDPAQQ